MTHSITPCYWLLLLSAHNLCEQFGPRSGPTESKLFDTLLTFLKELFEKVKFEKKSADDNKNMKYYPEYKSQGPAQEQCDGITDSGEYRKQCSGIVVEIIKAAGDTGATMILNLATVIICDGKVPNDWEQSFIVCLYKGKGDALDRGNYRGLKLTEQAMKILERIVDGLIRQVVSIDNSQFGFVPGRGTTDAIFVVQQLQENFLAVNKRLYMAYVDLEKAFDCVPLKVIWWALRKLGVEEWIVRLVQGMYTNAQSRVRVGEGFSKEFEVKVRVHQGSVLSPMLFIMCWRPCHVSFGLVSLGRTYMQMILSSVLTP